MYRQNHIHSLSSLLKLRPIPSVVLHEIIQNLLCRINLLLHNPLCDIRLFQ